MKKKSIAIIQYFKSHKIQIAYALLFLVFIFFRFYQLRERAVLGWDQADSAWAAKNILLEQHVRLEGVPIKGNAGMFMGPLYYYLITPFYYFTRLDMIAAPIFAGFVSCISFLIFVYITKKIFNDKVALISACIYTFSLSVMLTDRVQAAFVLIPIISYSIFYFLYKYLSGDEKYILAVSAVIGFGFHIHFTTIFYIPILFLSIVFFPKTKKSLIYCVYSIGILLLFLSPQLYLLLSGNHTGSNGIVGYLMSSYHGFHIRRLIQIAHDGFISFEKILQFRFFRPFVFILLPAYIFIQYISTSVSERKKAFVLSYLMVLWVVVPWVSLSLYNGELTDYYFSLPQNIAIIVIAYMLVKIYYLKGMYSKYIVYSLLVIYGSYSTSAFFNTPQGNYTGIQERVRAAIKNKTPISFKDRDPEYYVYYIKTILGK